jgi:hypothetical protein
VGISNRFADLKLDESLDIKSAWENIRDNMKTWDIKSKNVINIGIMMSAQN